MLYCAQVVGGDVNIVLPCASPKLLSPPIDPLQAPLALIICVSKCRLACAARGHDSQQGEPLMQDMSRRHFIADEAVSMYALCGWPSFICFHSPSVLPVLL